MTLFCSTLLLDLNLPKYWWSITHSLPRHGQYWYLTETLTKNQCSAQQTLLKSDVKNEHISNIWSKWKKKLALFQSILIKSYNLKSKPGPMVSRGHQFKICLSLLPVVEMSWGKKSKKQDQKSIDAIGLVIRLYSTVNRHTSFIFIHNKYYKVT